MAFTLLTHQKMRLLLLAGWLMLTALQVYILREFSLPWPLALVDGGLSNLLLGSAGLLISTILHHYRPTKHGYLTIVAWCALLTGLWLFLDYQALLALFPTDETYRFFLRHSLPIRFGYGGLVIGWSALLSLLWYNQLEEKKHQQRQSQAEKLAREVELSLLRQQLHPHFLFNSLNSISALVGRRPEEARSMIYQLSEFLRGTIKQDTNQWVTLQAEWQHLQLYLDIEKVRFGHRLATHLQAEEACQTMSLPPMLLQPIVENAIKFGLYDTTEAVTICVTATCQDHMLVLRVQNPFDPKTSASQPGTGFGLNGVQRRLYLLFGRQDLLETSAANETFTTIIRIPQP